MFGTIETLDDLKTNLGVKKLIHWDVEPKEIMDPRCPTGGTGVPRRTLSGFFFYIDKIAGAKPALYLMRHKPSGNAETVALISEIPMEILEEAVEEGKDRQCYGMYPINKKVEGWLKTQLGMQE